MVELATAQNTTSPGPRLAGPGGFASGQRRRAGRTWAGYHHHEQLLNRQLKLADHHITGHVIHVDHYGNLITNITRDSIETIGHDRTFTVSFAREKVYKMSTRYSQPPEGECVCIYNSQNFLCIGINKGHASELLGLHFDSQVDVHFPPNTSD